MGVVIDPTKAFKVCHGYKIDGFLALFSKGVIGMLSKDQIEKCQTIIIENAVGQKVFHSVEEAMKAKVVEDKHMAQTLAIRHCAHLLHEAHEEGIIKSIADIPVFMDYCMYVYGFGKLKHEIPERIEKWINEHAENVDHVLEAIRKLQQPAEQP